MRIMNSDFSNAPTKLNLKVKIEDKHPVRDI